MSVRFQITAATIRLAGLKRMFTLPEDALLARARRMNEKRGFRIPERKLHYADVRILDRWHCLRIGAQAAPSRRALLFLFGGGMILGPDDGDVKLAEKLGRASGRDVWFPYYPLCTDCSIRATYDMVYAVYRRMLAEYAPDDIALAGFSSGGALAIGICLHNNEQPAPLPMPGSILAVSPGCVPLTNLERRRMDALSKKDFLIDARFMTSARHFMEHGEALPNYMLNGAFGNFANLPPIHFWYGSNEVLYAAAPSFAWACAKYNVPCEMHVGEGLCHCYPMFSFYPEGKRAQAEMVRLLRRGPGEGEA